MANYSAIKAAVNAYIKANGKKEITGHILNSVLNATIDSLGKEFQFGGVLTPANDPGRPDQNVAYIGAAGTYPNFDGLVIASGTIGIFMWNGDWSFATIPVGKDYDNDIQSLTHGLQELYENIQELSDDVIHLDGINEEDLSIPDGGKLQFANRVYNAQQPNGMGYVILRKNKTFAEQVTEANTIYEIRYDFDLGGDEVTIPAGCELRFDGGKILNGTINFGNTLIDAPDVVVFDGVTFANTTSTQKVRTIWFGVVPEKADNYATLQNLIDEFLSVFVTNGDFNVLSTLVVSSSSRLRFIESNKAMQGYGQGRLIFTQSDGFRIEKRINMVGLYLSGTRGTFNSETGAYEGGYIGIDCRASCNLFNLGIAEFMVGIDTQNGLLINAIFDGVVIEKCGNIGINFIGYSPDDHNNIACTIQNCYVVNTGKDGLVEGTQSTGLVSGHGLVIRGGSCNRFYNNVFEYNSGCGVYVVQPIIGSSMRGFYFCGNDFEYNKYAQLYIDINTANSALVDNFLVKGNFYSDANRTLAPDSVPNRGCCLLDKFAWFDSKYLMFDTLDRSIYNQYGKPGVVCDMNLVFKTISPSSNYDAVNDCLSLVYGDGRHTMYCRFIQCRCKKGLYKIVVNAKNSGENSRVLAIRIVVNGTSVNNTQSIFTSWNTYRDIAIGSAFYMNVDNGLVYFDTLAMNSATSGDKIDIKSFSIVSVTSATTSDIESKITNPDAGFSIYDSTRGKMIVWNGSAWVNMDGSALS